MALCTIRMNKKNTTEVVQFFGSSSRARLCDQDWSYMSGGSE